MQTIPIRSLFSLGLVLSTIFWSQLCSAEHISTLQPESPRTLGPSCTEIPNIPEAVIAREKAVQDRLLEIQTDYANDDAIPNKTLLKFFNSTLSSLRKELEDYKFAMGCRNEHGQGGVPGSVGQPGGNRPPVSFSTPMGIAVLGGASNDRNVALQNWKQVCAAREEAFKKLYSELNNGVIVKEFKCSMTKDTEGNYVPDQYITSGSGRVYGTSKAGLVLQINNPNFEAFPKPSVLTIVPKNANAESEIEGWADYESDCFSNILTSIDQEIKRDPEKVQKFIYRGCGLSSRSGSNFSASVTEIIRP